MIKIKIAEALVIRSGLQKKLDSLKVRLVDNAKIQEGSTPPEEPEELMIEFRQSLEELEDIINKINKSNSMTIVDDKGITLSELLVKRDMLKLKIGTLTALNKEASERDHMYNNAEIRILRTVNTREIRKEIDLLSAEYRKIDIKIQETNWLTEI